MNELISHLSQKLGIPESAVKSGIETVLGILAEKLSEADLEKLTSLVPGAADLLANLPKPSAAGAPSGGIFAMAGGLLGGAGEAAKVLGEFQKAGVPMEKIAPLARGFFDRVREAGGEDLIGRLTAAVPALGAILVGK